MAAYTPDKHGPTGVTASYADLIASDGSNTHVIRTFSIVNTSASTRTVYITIGAGAAGTEILEEVLPAHTTVVRNGWWVVPTSTAVQQKQDSGTDCTVTASGYHYA